MRKKWIEFNKIVLIFSMVISIIAVGVFAAYHDEHYQVIMGLGLLIILCIHGIWGMFIEMASNIYHLSDQVINYQRISEGKEPIPINQMTWSCPKCGTVNKNNTDFCTHCKTPKNIDVALTYIR